MDFSRELARVRSSPGASLMALSGGDDIAEIPRNDDDVGRRACDAVLANDVEGVRRTCAHMTPHQLYVAVLLAIDTRSIAIVMMILGSPALARPLAPHLDVLLFAAVYANEPAVVSLLVTRGANARRVLGFERTLPPAVRDVLEARAPTSLTEVQHSASLFGPAKEKSVVDTLAAIGFKDDAAVMSNESDALGYRGETSEYNRRVAEGRHVIVVASRDGSSVRNRVFFVPRGNADPISLAKGKGILGVYYAQMIVLRVRAKDLYKETTLTPFLIHLDGSTLRIARQPPLMKDTDFPREYTVVKSVKATDGYVYVVGS